MVVVVVMVVVVAGAEDAVVTGTVKGRVVCGAAVGLCVVGVGVEAGSALVSCAGVLAPCAVAVVGFLNAVVCPAWVVMVRGAAVVAACVVSVGPGTGRVFSSRLGVSTSVVASFVTVNAVTGLSGGCWVFVVVSLSSAVGETLVLSATGPWTFPEWRGGLVWGAVSVRDCSDMTLLFVKMSLCAPAETRTEPVSTTALVNSDPDVFPVGSASVGFVDWVVFGRNNLDRG